MRSFYLIFCLVNLLLVTAVNAQPFTEVAAESGLLHSHSNEALQVREALRIASGAAAGDIDNDGDTDIFLVGGGNNNSALFLNLGNGKFLDIAAQAGVQFFNVHNSGPVFADLDNDGWQDLVVLSVNSRAEQSGVSTNDLINRPRVFINQKNNRFIEHADSGFTSGMQSFGAALADLDRDGDLDIFMTHWNRNDAGYQFFWLNDGCLLYTSDAADE